MSRDRIRAIIDDAVASGGGWLDIDRSRELLEACGIRLAQVRAADTFESALQAARAIGYPIVLKAVGPTILHKTEVGGVRLGISDDADLETAYRDMAARLGSALSGVAVQEMVVGGAEFIAGAATDPVFGPFVLFGSGGTLVELLADASMRLVPLTDVDVDDMLHEVRGTALMRGYRGAPQADEAAMRELLMRLSAMIEIAPEILEIDLNPVKVLARGVVAVDARVRIAQPSGG